MIVALLTFIEIHSNKQIMQLTANKWPKPDGKPL